MNYFKHILVNGNGRYEISGSCADDNDMYGSICYDVKFDEMTEDVILELIKQNCGENIVKANTELVVILQKVIGRLFCSVNMKVNDVLVKVGSIPTMLVDMKEDITYHGGTVFEKMVEDACAKSERLSVLHQEIETQKKLINGHYHNIKTVIKEY